MKKLIVVLLGLFVTFPVFAAKECRKIAAVVPCNAAGAAEIDECKDQAGDPLGDRFIAVRTTPSIREGSLYILGIGSRSIRMCTLRNLDDGCCIADAIGNLVCQIPPNLEGAFRLEVTALDAPQTPARPFDFSRDLCRQGMTVQLPF